jgi:hypothetical protein
MMILRDRVKDPNTMIRIGLGFLILANVSQLFLHRIAGSRPDVVDATNGVLFGVSIGCMVLGMLIARRSGRGDGPCA